ncbi:N(4)-(beta-N-acetylglucosaminyl)-L-asparaginase [Flavilitoribacter nigricans]|uniref:Glycosylasparaginase n=1 Tax=Flavilitoribacter nigricans (strain ATCC 23147 / DSM 23189 / NBRC 102662 / NCIMB 1420 / SS-2) TaxID=1122177 RepID=A0A2D0NFX6_FLAN2|nr:N(4)-(beta-N-acetylglucosaminyl)-L-asparaginase [Flavilitoribacter nigricans]PHN07404.1 glycosylasparaginase [Flavilitoribacter nigricans DSM 23189 = NBRC 102662]
MFKRRKFIKKGLLGAIAISSAAAACESTATETPDTTDQQGPSDPVNPNSKAGTPVVIATWPHLPATEEAMRVIGESGRAVDAVEMGVKVVEADPKDTSVGYGGLPDRSGIVTLDACIMDETGNAGSVTYLKNILHPISVARLVMDETPHVMLSGSGALAFAKENGFEETDLLTEGSKAAYEKWLADHVDPKVDENQHDTIGMLAIDKNGNISGACTTSGAAYKLPGRVGDSPIIGAGLFVDNEVGAATATGLGELVMKTLGSFLVVELMRNGASPQAACEEAVRRISEKHLKGMDTPPQVGFIAINKKGEHGAYSLSEGFKYTIYQGEDNQVIDSEFELK